MNKTELDEEHEWNIRKALIIKPPIVIGVREVLGLAKTRPDFLVDGRIPRKGISMLAGPPGSSKSWLAYDLAVGLIQGADQWLGKPLCKRAGERVLVLNYDNPTSELGRRMLRLGLHDSDQGMIHFHTPDRDPLRLPKASEDLLAMVSALRPTLVLVDSLRQGHTSDENDSGEMAAVMSQFKSWVQECGCAVLLIHHTNKDTLATGTSSVRGSVEIPASCDCIVEVGAADRGVSEARWTKHRSWPMSSADESLRFVVRDQGDDTYIEPAPERPARGRA